jgi:hypothetical protein
MSLFRRIGATASVTILGIALTFLGIATPLILAAQPAQAAINPVNCTFSGGQTDPPMRYVATCNDWTPPSAWYLQVTCQRSSTGNIYYANGNMVYGGGTSRAACGLNSEGLALNIVNVY